MKKHWKKRKLSESSEDPDDPAVFNPSPVRGGLGLSRGGVGAGGLSGVGGGGGPPSPEGANGIQAHPPHEGMGTVGSGEAYLGSYSTELGFQGMGSEFKRPRMEGDGDRGRRFSQASTNSSTSFCDDEGSVDRDAALLSRTLDSTSSSDTEDEFSHRNSSGLGSSNGFYSRSGVNNSLDDAQQRSYDDGEGGGSHAPSRLYGDMGGAAGSSAPPKTGGYSTQAERMMSLMGYQSGTGLGKAAQGRLEPVAVSTQRGRRGLGHIIEGLESDETLDWTPEPVVVREQVAWLPINMQQSPTLQELRSWIKFGRRNEDISEETRYCDPEVLKDVLSCKSVFDKLESHEMMKARTRSNPFETIGKGIFQNRAAMKMANMDAVFQQIFTDPRDDANNSLVHPDEPLYFADVCAGPGGFSEYVLWKKKWRAKGFGFTLKDGKHDFKLEEFYAGPPEGFETYYGVDGYNGDGNIFRSDNMKELERYVRASTGNLGVHFMMADGGFSVEGSENIQEILSKQLYLCQIIVALAIVREKGHFVCKLFDLFTPFSVGLVYLMYRSFQQVCIHKPNTSRPANSERYIVCKGKRPHTEDVLEYLYEVNKILEDLKFDLSGRTASNQDIIEIVPDSVMDPDFLNYMIQSNDAIGRNQVLGLEKIAVFYKNRDLYEKRQAEVRKESLEFWNVPDGGRIKPRIEDPHRMVQRLLNDSSALRGDDVQLNAKDDLTKHIKSVYDWRYVVVGAKSVFSDSNQQTQELRTFVASTGRQRVSYLAANGRWQLLSNISNCRIDLPAETILYAEIIWEMKGESKAQKKVMSVHVIDGMFLAGEDIRPMHLNERNRYLNLFLKVMNKPSQNDLVRLRPKIMFKLDDILTDNSVWSYLSEKNIKGKRDCQVFTNPEPDADGHHKFFQAKGLLLYKHVKDPYMMAMSKSHNRKYYFNTRTRKPAENFSTPKDCIAGFENCHSSRLVWNFMTPYQESGSNLTKEDFLQFIHKIKH